MDLHFHSLSELTEFLTWVDARRPASVIAGIATLDAAYNSPAVAAAVADAVQTAAEVAHELAGAVSVDVVEASGAAGEPVKRKRRTKAEMEAAALAELNAGADTSALTKGNPGPASGAVSAQDGQPTTSVGGNNPFASLLGADGTPALAPAATGAEQPATEQPANPADLAAVAAALGEVSATDHLNKCREYIAKHGLAAYNETFAKAGLTANVLAFTGEQRALHVAVLAG